MEPLQKISKKYLFLSLTMLMMTMGVVSCESCGGKEDGKTGSLELAFDQPQLLNLVKKTTLTIKASTATKLAGLKLIAKLTTSGTADKGTVKLTGRSAAHTVEVGKDITVDLYPLLGLNEGDELGEGKYKSVDIEFFPGTEQDLKLDIKVQKGDEVVGAEKTVAWKATDILLDFEKQATPLTLVGDVNIDLGIVNGGITKTKADQIKVIVTKTGGEDGVTVGGVAIESGGKVDLSGKNFVINKTDGAQALSLPILGHGKNAADFTVQLEYAGTAVGTAVTVNWKKS